MADELIEPIESVVQTNKNAGVLTRMRGHCESIVLNSSGEPILYDLDLKQAKIIAKNVEPLRDLARSVVRTTDPCDDLIYFRIKSVKEEILVACDDNFTIISIQKKEDNLK